MKPGARSSTNGSGDTATSGSGATYDATSYGSQVADLYDEWYGLRAGDAGICEFLMEMSAGGPALEIGVGTGRIALELEARGVTVVGVDVSAHMLARCRSRSPTMPLVRMDAVQIGDLALLQPGLVYCTMGTFFQLGDRRRQLRVLDAAARCVSSDGYLVVDAWQPPQAPCRLPTVHVTDQVSDGAHLRQVTVHDAVPRIVSYWQFLHRPGQMTRVVHRRDHYLDTQELEDLAAGCGWHVVGRFADFLRHPLLATSPFYVEVFKRRDAVEEP
jgi:ubiquinone/menaquinone biosynthesis C-methylase UbiE